MDMKHFKINLIAECKKLRTQIKYTKNDDKKQILLDTYAKRINLLASLQNTEPMYLERL